MLEIRKEYPNEYKEIENMVREAFWDVYQPGCDEHLVVHKLREDKSYIKDLSYILIEDGKKIGFIFYSLVYVKTSDNRLIEAISFGPVGVLPEYQGKGYGSKLIEFTLEKALEGGYPAVFITGNPEYYHRFGFKSASKYGIYIEGMDKSDEAPFSMVKVLKKEWINDVKGVIIIPECYYCTKEETEEFDKGFSAKEKHVKEGQFR